MRSVTILMISLVCISACLAQPLPTNRFQIWLQGYHHRQALLGKPVTMAFEAVDGRKVDLSQMRSKVVLVDFWDADCVPCVAEMPRIKAALGKYQQKGFEVIGISDDTDKIKLERCLKEKEITWPQYFDGQQGLKNRLFAEFGINGMPHMFLIDKKGCLRFDDVQATGPEINFEGKIESLLAE
ncbi:MAG TPA: TlpA disulfide reductase family protein [Desulfuromonadaceae bacterium]|nr:TlpA disulfide reductase family protein [Desulfuromonadaceae bacterium]